MRNKCITKALLLYVGDVAKEMLVFATRTHTHTHTHTYTNANNNNKNSRLLHCFRHQEPEIFATMKCRSKIKLDKHSARCYKSSLFSPKV